MLITLFLLHVFSHIYYFLCLNRIRLYQNFGYFYSKVVVIRMKLVMFSFLICFIHSFIYIILVVWWPLKETILLHPHWGCGTTLITKEMKNKKIDIFYFNFSEWGKNESISPTVLVRNQNVRNFWILLHSIWTGN